MLLRLPGGIPFRRTLVQNNLSSRREERERFPSVQETRWQGESYRCAAARRVNGETSTVLRR